MTVDFEFLTKQEMADDHHMSPQLSSSFVFVGSLCKQEVKLLCILRDDIAKCVAAAEAEPEKKIRWLE